MQAPTDHEPAAPARHTRRAVLGLALGATLGSIGLPVGLAVAKPKPTRQAKPMRKAKRGGRPKADARRRPKRTPQAKPRFKVVTRTFTSLVPITIPGAPGETKGPASPYPSTIQVGGFRAGTIQDVNVALSGLSHTYPADLEVILVAPAGQASVVLMSEVGDGGDVTSLTLGFDDQAASFLPFDAPIVGGVFKPTFLGPAPSPDTATLRSFNGLNPNGTWRLYAADGTGGDTGSIAGWALTIRARVRR